MGAAVTQVIVALIGAIALVLVAWIARGRESANQADNPPVVPPASTVAELTAEFERSIERMESDHRRELEQRDAQIRWLQDFARELTGRHIEAPREPS